MENTQPLSSIIAHVTAQVQSNDLKIRQIANFVDTQLNKLPNRELGTSSINDLQELLSENGKKIHKDDAKEPDVWPAQEPITDTLRYHLETKYSIKTIGGSRIEQLQSDISQLKQIHRGKLLRNKQLYEILQEYENSILFVILPSLRDRLADISRSLTSETMVTAVEKRFEGLNDIYSLYLRNIEMLMRLVSAFKVLLRYLDDEEFAGVYHQFVVLEELISGVTKSF